MRKLLIVCLHIFLVSPLLHGQTLPLPELTGPHPVGTTIRHFIDDSRENTFTDDPDDARELVVQIWYPTISGNTAPLVYMPDADVIGPQARSIGFPFPQELEDYYQVLDSHSVVDAPVAINESGYPLLIFSHACSAMKTQNVYQMEELASHGYIVAAIAHTYNSLAVRFPDERVINWVAESTIKNDEFFRHTDDVDFVLDRLTDLNSDDLSGLFTNRLNLDRVGVFGMSVGGAVAALATISDPRVDAGINMDGTLCFLDVEGVPDFTEICDQGIDDPFMIMLHDGHLLEDENTDPNTVLRGGGNVVTISDTAHFDFSEIPMVWNLAGLDGVYPAAQSEDPVRVVRIFTDYSLAFFNQHLKDIPEPILMGDSPSYPEVAMEVFAPQTSSVPFYSAYE